jgi:mono/diheme cytochrome c family protein/rhodanese-related sulfurtransferase
VLARPLFVASVLAALAGFAACKRVGPGIGATADETPAAAGSSHGAELYGKLCALCHGAQREGYKADNAPSLASPTFLATASDDFLRAAIVRGRPGTAMGGYGKATGGPLDDADIAALIGFLRQGGPKAATAPSLPAGDAMRGRTLYTAQCATCHGQPGQRGTAVHLANPIFLASASDSFLGYAIVHGRPGTKMEAWGAKLDAQQVGDVITFMRSWVAPPVIAPRPPPPERPVPKDLPIVLNPSGKAASFTLKEERYVPMADVKKALDDKRRIIIVDARPPLDWMRGHITGAISIPYYDMEMIAKLPTDGTWVLTYCACPHHASGIVLDELRKRGFAHSAVIDEGILAWQRAGFPAVDGDGKPAEPPPALPPSP